MAICTCDIPTAPVVVVNHLTDDLEPSHATYQCTGCGEFEISEPDFEITCEEFYRDFEEVPF